MAETLLGVFKYFKLKILLAILPSGLFYWSEDYHKILAIILWILIVDTTLGIMVSIKYKTFSSCRMAKMTYKFILYGMTMATAYLISMLFDQFNWVFYAIGSYIVMNEAVSNFEKLALLGFRVPVKLLSKISKDFEHIYDNNGKSADAVQRLLFKEKCLKK